MTDPTKIAIQPQDVLPFIYNGDTTYEDQWWRVQRFDPSQRQNITPHFQLGSKDPIGTTQDNPEFDITVQHMMHDVKAELVMAGKDPASDTAYNLGDVLDQDNLRVNLLERNLSGVPVRELEFDTGMVATLTWAFQVGSPSTVDASIRAALGKLYYEGSGSLPHTSGFITDDTSSPGAILGKDCRVMFGTDDAAGRAYRLQRLTIRAAIPIDTVRELGRRSLVGIMNRMPTVTVDFDLLAADFQPHDVFFNANTDADAYYDLGDPKSDTDLFIRLYDPDLAEADTVIRAWVLENADVGNVTPMSISVNGQAMTRYSLTLSKPDTAGTAGLICYVGDIP